MKQNDFQNINQLASTSMANIFNVYSDNEVDYNAITFNLNRTINIVGIQNASTNLYDKYEVVNNDTWHLISYKKYGTADLWWIICKANGIADPTIFPEAGTVIIILKQKFIDTILTTMRNS